jgi:pimeloyl-ACP methyl ester carboxylesterase
MDAQVAQRGADARALLLSGLDVAEHRLVAAGISTSVLVGGAGRTVLLLHGPGEHAAKWARVMPRLSTRYRVVAPDLPGHGATEAGHVAVDAERVLSWLDELIRQTCDVPPIVVGQLLGGSIAARFASRYGDRLERLVLADALGLAAFQPAPEFGQALMDFVRDPTGEKHDQLWKYCAFDLDRLRDSMGEQWDHLRAYNLDRAGAAGLAPIRQMLMEQFGMPAIPEAELANITVPTALVWGRNDLATPLHVAESARDRYGWPLHVIDRAGDDPAIERPAEFVRVLAAMCEGEGRAR